MMVDELVQLARNFGVFASMGDSRPTGENEEDVPSMMDMYMDHDPHLMYPDHAEEFSNPDHLYWDSAQAGLPDLSNIRFMMVSLFLVPSDSFSPPSLFLFLFFLSLFLTLFSFPSPSFRASHPTMWPLVGFRQPADSRRASAVSLWCLWAVPRALQLATGLQRHATHPTKTPPVTPSSPIWCITTTLMIVEEKSGS